jgi:hypothetical protein
MTYSATCPSCSRRIALTYDEADCTPIFCPFCGEEVGDEALSDYDKGADFIMGDEWDDEDR